MTNERPVKALFYRVPGVQDVPFCVTRMLSEGHKRTPPLPSGLTWHQTGPPGGHIRKACMPQL